MIYTYTRNNTQIECYPSNNHENITHALCVRNVCRYVLCHTHFLRWSVRGCLLVFFWLFEERFGLFFGGKKKRMKVCVVKKIDT